MLKVAIVGGRLQGVEAAYLAKKAGMRTILIDKNENTIASALCDEVKIFDVLKKEPQMIEQLRMVDFILPALENEAVLQVLKDITAENDLKLAFDNAAYAISSSKLKSDQLMRENKIPAPRYYPYCSGPYVIKPSGESGSSGVKRVETNAELKSFLENEAQVDEWVIQEFLEGPSYSIEVIGVPGNYHTYLVTEIHMDDDYDCKKVTAPCGITETQKEDFEEVARKLAELIGLHGIMDVEVIDHKGIFKVLEVDARIPSQTPTVVYHASGVNQIVDIADVLLHGGFRQIGGGINRFCTYEHFRISKSGCISGGEHIMSTAKPLMLKQDFFGADEVLTDFDLSDDEWHGTFINWAETKEILNEKRERMMQALEQSCESLRLRR